MTPESCDELVERCSELQECVAVGNPQRSHTAASTAMNAPRVGIVRSRYIDRAIPATPAS